MNKSVVLEKKKYSPAVTVTLSESKDIPSEPLSLFESCTPLITLVRVLA